MFDALVLAHQDPAPAARTLATLVEGVVAIVALGAGVALDPLADAAGCGIVRAMDIPTLSSVLSTPHVIVLPAGALLPPGWPDQLASDLTRFGAPGALESVFFRPEALAARARLGVSTWIGRYALSHGALVPRSAVLTTGFNAVALRAPGAVRMAKLTVALSV
jgi:hypothetical protein